MCFIHTLSVFTSLTFPWQSLLDLDGEVNGSAAPSAPVASTQNTQDLLADIFGSSSETTAASQSSQPPPGAPKTVNDILGLFDSTPSAPSPATSMYQQPATSTYTSPTSTSNPLFSLGQVEASQPAQPPPQARPQAQSYTAYDNHELKITLTPQVSAARPGIVNIMARFMVSGSTAASNVNFQAAVPKVSIACVLAL